MKNTQPASIWCQFCERLGHHESSCDEKKIVDALRSPTYNPLFPSLCSCRGCSPYVSVYTIHHPRGMVLRDEQGVVVPRRSPLEPTGYGVRHCSGCGRSGHNVRTCQKRVHHG